MNKLDVQNAILNAMTPYLDDDQLYQLKNTLEETRLSVGKRTKICVKKNENLCQKFCAATETAGENYRPIQEEGKTVIVPYKEGMDILEKLETAQNMSDKKRLLRKIQRYTVSVYENKLKECLQNGVIEESRFLPDVYVAKNYDMEKGLLNELVLQYY